MSDCDSCWTYSFKYIYYSYWLICMTDNMQSYMQSLYIVHEFSFDGNAYLKQFRLYVGMATSLRLKDVFLVTTG